MKYLSQFLNFDFSKFMKGKSLQVVSCGELTDYNTKQHLGTKVEVVIIKDETEYRSKNGETAGNLYEKFTIKVLKDVTVPIGVQVEPVNPVVTVYGEYRNMISVRCEDIILITKQGRA